MVYYVMIAPVSARGIESISLTKEGVDIGWHTACPNCLENDLEKVGWGYWFCRDCGNMWEESSNVPVKGKTKVLETTEKPAPTELQIDKRISFPDL